MINSAGWVRVHSQATQVGHVITHGNDKNPLHHACPVHVLEGLQRVEGRGDDPLLHDGQVDVDDEHLHIERERGGREREQREGGREREGRGGEKKHGGRYRERKN